jgi:5-formyltetrahydrofolate cyclo-ligase
VGVPCVAFDSHGRRCGHGGGFYDRFIEELQQKREEAGQEKATLIGVALEEQLVETVVVGKYDTVMDYVVVPTGAIEM